MGKTLLRSALALVVVHLAPGCGSDAGYSPPPGADVCRAPEHLTIDAGCDAGVPMKCCRLDNARGERLDYKCSTALDTVYLEARRYRCWVVTPLP